ncbi:MAG: phosphatase PAP2 family protein [Actinomycetes bacterium]
MTKDWPLGRKISVAVWSAIAALFLGVRGIPFDRATQILFTITAALAFSVGTTTKTWRIFADWLPFFALLYGYDYSRGAADTFGFPVRVAEIYNIELSWFGRFFDGQIPTVYLQQHFYHQDHVAWWEAGVALIYCTHFIVPWVIVGTLYVRNRERWAMFARRIITISFAALLTYVVVPAAPPWYAAKAGLCEPIARIVTRGWSILGLPIAGQIISLGQGVVNKVAALPSLHAGMTVTISLFFWPRASKWLRAFLAFYMSFMVFALVYGGEHYIFDALLGAGYAVVIEYACRQWEKSKASRAKRAAEAPVVD